VYVSSRRGRGLKTKIPRRRRAPRRGREAQDGRGRGKRKKRKREEERKGGCHTRAAQKMDDGQAMEMTGARERYDTGRGETKRLKTILDKTA